MATAQSTDASQQRAPEELQGDHPTKVLLRQVWRRLNVRNEHWMHCIVGEEGSGKSQTAIKEASLIDPNFTHENVIFEPETLLETLRDEKYEAGDVYVFDEAGVGLGNRTWHDQAQVQFNQALQLIRDHNIGLVFTLPRLGELDTQTKGRLQSVLELVAKEEGEYVTGFWWNADPDRIDMSGDVYMQKPTVNGRQVGGVRFSPPPQSIIEPYNERKREFQKQVYDDTLDELDEDDEDEGQSIVEYADQVSDNEDLAQYLSWHGGHHKWTISTEELVDAFGITHADAKRLKDRLRERPDLDPQEAGEYRD